MIDKASGKIAYAVLTFGGFLGIGEDHYPLPWTKLRYDTALDGYKVDITEQQLRDAPKFGKNDNWDWSGRHELVTSTMASTRSGTDFTGRSRLT